MDVRRFRATRRAVPHRDRQSRYFVGRHGDLPEADQYFSDVPDRYPTTEGSYYPPTALHWTAHLGTELDWLPRAGFFERHGFYYELATVDTFAFAYFENRQTVGLTEALSSTLGYRAAW